MIELEIEVGSEFRGVLKIKLWSFFTKNVELCWRYGAINRWSGKIRPRMRFSEIFSGKQFLSFMTEYDKRRIKTSFLILFPLLAVWTWDRSEKRSKLAFQDFIVRYIFKAISRKLIFRSVSSRASYLTDDESVSLRTIERKILQHHSAECLLSYRVRLS